MKKNFMKKSFQKMLAFVLALALMLPVFNGMELLAAQKPSLNTKKMTISIGSYSANFFEDVHKEYNSYKIQVENKKKGATYTFSSKNKKIAKVKGKGTTGYITGVNAGTTTIVVKQKLKGKTTTIGSCKVTVKKATLANKNVGFTDFYLGDEQALPPGCKPSINYYNPDATYSFVCKDSNFTMKELLFPDEASGYTAHYLFYTAKKPGTYKVTVKETYKGKTRSLGSFNAIVNTPEVQSEVLMLPDFDLGAQMYLINAGEFDYCVEGDGFSADKLSANSIVHVYEIENRYYIKAINPGTVKLNYYYMTDKQTKGELIGSCNITVLDPNDAELIVPDTYEFSLSDEAWGHISVSSNPEAFVQIADISATSSDDSIVEIQWTDLSGISFTAKKPGTAIVTITAEHISKQVKVIVTE